MDQKKYLRKFSQKITKKYFIAKEKYEHGQAFVSIDSERDKNLNN